MVQTQVEPKRGIGYLPALDGVRAWAVLSVMVSHTSIMTHPFQYLGGAVGVDIFFVLSGFLITSLLMSERRQTGRVRIGAFYARRGLRLLPALFVTLVLGVFATAWFGSNLSGRPYWQAALLTLTYLGNWFQAITPDLGILGHVWSLAIEEQYYIIWPSVMILLTRRGTAPRRLAVVIALAAIASHVARGVVFETTGFLQAYNWTFTHLGGILLGSALGLLLIDPPGWTRVFKRPLVPTVGVAVAIVASILIHPFEKPYYTGLGLVVELGAAMVIAHIALEGRSWVSDLLALRPLVYIGRISYGIYLFHPLLMWPLWKAVPQSTASWWLSAIASGVGGVVIAGLSYRFIERPALKLKRRFEPEGHQYKRPV